MYQSESITEDFIERTDGNNFSVRRVTRKPHGPEYPVFVAMAGRDKECISINSEGTAADLLEEVGIHEPEKYKVEYQGEIIQSDGMLSDFGVGAEATVDVTHLLDPNAISGSIYVLKRRPASVFRDMYTPYDLVELDCDAKNHAIWRNGRKLKRVKFDGYTIEIEEEGEYDIQEIFGHDEMRDCLSKFR